MNNRTTEKVQKMKSTFPLFERNSSWSRCVPRVGSSCPLTGRCVSRCPRGDAFSTWHAPMPSAGGRAQYRTPGDRGGGPARTARVPVDDRWEHQDDPSPVHESEKWKWSRSVVSNSSRPHGLQPTRLLRPWDFPGESTGVECHCLLRLLSWVYVNIREKEMAAHSSVLAWRISGTAEPGGLLSMGSHRVGHDWSDLAVATAC